MLLQILSAHWLQLKLKECDFFFSFDCFFFCWFHCSCWLKTSNYLKGSNWPGRLFHNLLVPPLDRALSLIQPQGITMFISQYLEKKKRTKGQVTKRITLNEIKNMTLWAAGKPPALLPQEQVVMEQWPKPLNTNNKLMPSKWKDTRIKSNVADIKSFSMFLYKKGLSSNCGGNVCCRQCILQRKCGISDCL